MDVHNYQAQEHLLDGRPLIIRAIRAGDRQILLDEFALLRKQDVFQRFFHVKKSLTTEELSFLTEPDFAKHVALVAAVRDRDSDHPAGVGRFITDPDDPQVADIALTVVKRFRRLGIATLLLHHLAGIARKMGYAAFTGDVLASNQAMMDVLVNSGLPMQVVSAEGISRIRLTLT
ncbi:MAG: GNAT family N-acetyltransferase [Saprospiraceae bacterium]|nr:GNAT family N-acetyltransferase [Saprospiraceae bacterium]